MQKILLMVNNKEYEVNYNKNYVRIDNSYEVKNDNVYLAVYRLRTQIYLQSGISYNRSVFSWAIEWIAHTRLYKLGLFRKHTKDVDIDENESKFRKVCYHLIALDYVIFLGLL